MASRTRAVFALTVALALVVPLLGLVGCQPPRPRRDTGTVETDGGGDGTDVPYVRPDTPPMDYGPTPPADDDNDGLSNDDELARGTDPNVADTDGDGFDDGVEVLAGTDPANSTSFIPPEDFYVVLPYMGEPQLRELSFRARLGQADVFFLIDTTGSMFGTLANVRSSLRTTIVPAIQDAIADVVMGVGDFRDFPIAPYAGAGDWALTVRQPLTSDVPAVQAALDALRAGGGEDPPEASTEGLWGSVAGPCASGAGFGGACFRSGSHPIIVHVTDQPFHNGPDPANNYDPSVLSMIGATAHTWSATTAALNANDIKVVGIAVSIATPFPLPIPAPSRSDLNALADATGSVGASGMRTVYTAPSGMVSTSAVDGIVDLVGAETQDVSSRTEDDTSDAIDATQFIARVTPVRATRATRFDATTFFGVSGGTQVTFEVEFRNDTVPARAVVQIYRAYIEVFDVAGGTELDRRNVYIVIPPDGGILF